MIPSEALPPYQFLRKSSTRRRYQLIPLAEVNAQLIKDVPAGGSDTIARDRFESTALDIPPPARTIPSFAPDVRILL